MNSWKLSFFVIYLGVIYLYTWSKNSVGERICWVKSEWNIACFYYQSWQLLLPPLFAAFYPRFMLKPAISKIRTNDFNNAFVWPFLIPFFLFSRAAKWIAAKIYQINSKWLGAVYRLFYINPPLFYLGFMWMW